MTTTSGETGLTLRHRPLTAALRAVAIMACLPYLGLKIAWIAGSHVGIPEGSALLDHRLVMAMANSLTVLMDASVVVLALLLTRPWGQRVPAPLLAVPMWAATGLLAPIMIGLPFQLVGTAIDGSEAPAAAEEPFLNDWVFGVVYGGFVLQGLALGTLFVLYAGKRWGHLWRGRVWDLPTGATSTFMRATAVAGSLLALFPAAMHTLWAVGGTTALPADRVLQRTTPFYLLEGVRVGFAVLAVTAVLLLAFRLRPAMPVRGLLAAAWVGVGALAAWAGWMILGALLPQSDEGKQTPALLMLTYAGEMISGLLLTCAVASLLRRRGA
jgi:hypothetical protein